MNKENILVKKEKLIEHFHYSEEGGSFFTPNFKNVYANSNFIQYLNTILIQPTANVSDLFESPVFEKITQFLKDPKGEHLIDTKIHVSGHSFFIQAIIFEDKSFEIIIRDISESEKRSFDRAEMVNNMAHELRTPVASISGFLEMLIEYKNLSQEKRAEFIQRAYKQVLRLSEIIRDIIIISKTNEAPQTYEMTKVNIYETVQELLEEAGEMIKECGVTVNCEIGKDVVIMGNPTLIASVFWNLLSNALKYAGENVTIDIRNYMEDEKYYYFSFEDNGKGIEDKYLERIFERFYRITEGRTRKEGGSGLGLAIVRDVVDFHHGKVHAKNRSTGGLAFLFSLRKK